MADRWGYYDGDRLAAVIEVEAACHGATAVDEHAAATLAAMARHAAERHARIDGVAAAVVDRMTRRELRRMLGAVLDVLSDEEARAHARRVLTTPEWD